jgi:uncharacterized membrane protein
MGHNWMELRQAYTPRLWPQVLVAAPIVAAAAVVFDPMPWWGPFLLGFVVATVIHTVVWERWSRKHPPMSYEQYMAMVVARTERELEARRKAAPWN